MLTTKDILLKACEEFDLPYQTVEENYKAFVLGLKDRLKEEPTLKIYVDKHLSLYFSTKTPAAFHGKDRILVKYRKIRKRRKEIVKKIKEKLRENNNKQTVDKYTIYCQNIPIMYYGIKQGYSLKELEDIQNRFFDKFNKYDYEGTKKAKNYLISKNKSYNY